MNLTFELFNTLHRAFFEAGLTVTRQTDHMIVENSEECTRPKICRLVRSLGFCPLVSANKLNSKFAFSLAPFRLPEFFQKKSPLMAALPASQIPYPMTHCSEYLSKDEALQLLKKFEFLSANEGNKADCWADINNLRSLVLPALNQALADVLLPHIREDWPVVEIGSGIGYSLPDSLSERTIRIQPAPSECQLLKKTTTGPVYQLDIHALCNILAESGKKIPLFFALNVFDVLPAFERLESLRQISRLQNSGDRIVIMLDTNPLLDSALEQLQATHPEDAIFPFFPLKSEPAKLAFLIVPLRYVQSKPTLNDLLSLMRQQTVTLNTGGTPEMQLMLHQLRNQLNLKVVVLEDFFKEQVSKDLAEAGYASKSYYHASFTAGELPERYNGIQQDLVYKSVTDNANVRQWTFEDAVLLNWLSQKGISIPKKFDKSFLADLKARGQKIFGAEIFVVEAVKI